jgi:hypothetical protein
MVREDQQNHRYWFGRYAGGCSNTSWKRTRKRRPSKDAQAETPPDEEPLPLQAEAFVNALQRAPHQKFDHLQLIVLATYAPGFLDAVEELIKNRPDLRPWIRNMKLVHFDPLPERYILDDHWTPAGHREVADRLLPLVAH